MSESRCWAVDRLAASKLLAGLKIEAVPDLVEKVAIEFATHRQDTSGWVAEHVRSKIVQVLQAHSTDYSQGRSDEFSEGFLEGLMLAEMEVADLSFEELLGRSRDSSRTKGEILRSMMRYARRQSALVERRTR